MCVGHRTFLSMNNQSKHQKQALQRQNLIEVRHDRQEEGAGQYLLFTRTQLLPTPSKYSNVLEEIRRTYICPEELFFIPGPASSHHPKRKGNTHA